MAWLIIDPASEIGRNSDFEYAFPYINNSPVQTTDEDTGVDPTLCPANCVIIASVIFTVDASSVQYAVVVQADNQLVQLQPGLRQLRTGEPVTGGGDVAFAFWLDSGTNTYHYSLDVDGAGKTLNSVSLVARFF